MVMKRKDQRNDMKRTDNEREEDEERGEIKGT